MIKSFEYEGVWWLPDKPEEKASGKLRFDPFDGIRLILNASLEANTELGIIKSERAKIILGSSLSGGKITLLHCYNLFGGIFPIAIFSVEYIFIGIHFYKPEEITFRSISVQFQYLPEWLGETTTGIRKQSPKPPEKCYKIFYEPFIEVFKGKLDDETNISINLKDIDRSLPTRGIGIEEEVEIKIESSKDSLFSDCKNRIDKIQNFLSFVLTNPTYPTYLEGETEIGVQDKTPSPVQIYYKVHNSGTSSEYFSPDNMLFTFKDICDNLETFLKKWLEMSKELETILELYLGVLYAPAIYEEHKFLSYIQALEAYHRQKGDGGYLPKNVYKNNIYKNLKECIKDLQIDNNLKKRLLEIVQYGYELSLRDRIEDLFNQHSRKLTEFTETELKDLLTEEELKKLKNKEETLKKKEIKEKFIDKVVKFRNVLTHRDKGSEDKVSNINLDLVNRRLELLLQAILLREMGIEESKIEEIIEKKINFYKNDLRYIKKFKL